MSQDSGTPLVSEMKSTAMATNSQIDSSAHPGYGDAGHGGSTPGSSRSSRSLDKRMEFRQRVGIKPETGDLPEQFLFRNRLEKAYKDQTRFYYIVMCVSHGMLWLQIGIGASVTALGTTNSNAARIAITVLGAVNTVIAGFLTFLKSRNQPNRALQFRNGLRGVYEDLWQIDAEMLSGRADIDVDQKVDDLWKKYKEVTAEAEANYPDLWVSLGKLIKPADGDKHPSTQLKDVSPGEDDEERKKPSREVLMPKTGA
ncbi:hypothetical protein AYL99_11264 [Fonsecaea erecta]|uniref:SMODS and SLOG-associating 2TM effector domain-containing protein n=1 Tax=Fonsecaea erecta TaxID=1367422 RepID=A0A178Z5S7_9EURO|nr:hypothetical protein AYL99_11264 [Fonsecaea erecta]OAP54816.1 hypothetical protein AYL99_11264 [Fonsecaea erecta]